MLEIFSLVLYLFMAQRYSLLLFLIIPASFFTVGELPLFPCKFFLCFPVKHRITGSFPVENTHIPRMAKSIPRNFSAGLFSTVWLSQQNKRLAKYFPDGSWLTVTDFSSQSDGICRWSFIFMADIFGSFRCVFCKKIFPFTALVV